MDISFLYNWFHQYSQSFYSSDPEVSRGIRLKEEHSLQVAANSLALAKHLGTDERESKLAEAAGLMHDVARYTQWTQFQSFNDVATQYDHGTAGADILQAANILTTCFSCSEQDTILFSIIHHNKLTIPNAEPQKMRLAAIIRDADKLDIFRVLPPVIADHDYSPTLLRLLGERHPLPYAEAKKPADRRLLRLGWLYDVNFDWTLQQLVAKGYVNDILASLPDDDCFGKIKADFYRFAASKHVTLQEKSNQTRF